MTTHGSVEIFKEFTFESAHLLPHVSEGHKCGRLHGHSYRATVLLVGFPGEEGWVMDFGVVKERVNPVIDLLDHHYLNEIEGLDNPTSEVLAEWLFIRLQPELQSLTARLQSVTVSETCTSGATYPARQ